jgi:phosphate transport system substrate-binding protein
MRKVLVTVVLLLVSVGVAVCLVSCGRTSPSPSTTPELTDTIRVSGAWALYPMMVRWAEEYQGLHPEVQVGVWAGGAGKGVTEALGGVVEIGMVSRDIYPEEEQGGGFWVPVVKDAVVLVANADNPIAKDLAGRGLTRDQCAALWLGGKEATWGSLVSRAEVRDKVRVYTRSDVCGAAEAWARYLGKRQEDLLGTRVYGDPRMAEAVKKDPLGLGFNNLNYAYDADTDRPVAGLMPIPIDIDGDGHIAESESFYGTRTEVKRAIAEGVYPSPPARVLNLLTKGEPRGLTREFLLWILTDGQEYVDEAGYVQLPQQQLSAAVEKLG